MPISTTATADDLSRTGSFTAGGFAGATSDNRRSFATAVSWGAIIAGAAAAAALSLILLILGVGLGLSAVSPWARDGISATTFGVSTILWLTFTQLIASAVGGYLAGRLRIKWSEAQTDEVYFRDTAHGFLAWAVASLATATLMSSVIGSIVSGGVQAGATVASGAASTVPAALGAAASTGMASGMSAGSSSGPMAYFVDSLFRKGASAEGSGTTAGSTASNASTGVGTPRAEEATGDRELAEVSRIFSNFSRTEALPAEDLRYVGQLVSQHTGLSRAEAERRVADVYAKAQTAARDAEVAARSAADKARKASAYGALWLFVSLLIGAFVASLAATFGGRQRDA